MHTAFMRPSRGSTMSPRKLAALQQEGRTEIRTWEPICQRLRRSATLKMAGIESDGQDVPFEQALSNLAHAYLKSRAPQLLDYELGFQLLEKNEDNNKAAGIFGFKVGQQLIYVPVFFLNGKIRGVELMWLKESNTIVPCKEDWVNYILNRKPHVIGEEINRNARGLGINRPNLSLFRESPSKYASSWEPWVMEGLPGFAAIVANSADYKPVLPELVKSSAFQAMQLVRMVDAYPGLAKPLVAAFGADLFKQAVDTAKTLGTICPVRPAARTRRTYKTGSIFQEKRAQANPNEGLQIYIYDGNPVAGLNQPELQQLQRDGLLIRDMRKEASIVYRVDRGKQMENPTETGIYDLLCKPGSFERCLIVHGPYMGHGKMTSAVVVRLKDEGDKEWTVTHPADLFVDQASEAEAYRTWFSSVSGAESLQKGAKYVLVAPNGTGSGVFEVEHSLPAGGGEKAYAVSWCRSYSGQRPDHLPPLAERNPGGTGPRANQVVLRSEGGKKFTIVGEALYCPGGTKALLLESPDPDAPDCCCSCTCDSDAKSPLRPGNLLDVEMGLLKTSVALTVHANDFEARVDQRQMPIKAALIHLVRDYGMTEKAARDVLTEARKRGGCKCQVKLAAPYDLIASAPGAPTFPEQNYGQTSVLGMGYPTTQPQEEEVPVDGMYTAPPGTYDMSLPPSPQMIQQITEAAGTGQKEVLDASVVSNLLNQSQEDTLVDQHLGALVKATDALGRLLVNYWWHPDVFEARYGAATPELEDALRNAFDNVGDVSLKLKQKAIESSPDAGAIASMTSD